MRLITLFLLFIVSFVGSQTTTPLEYCDETTTETSTSTSTSTTTTKPTTTTTKTPTTTIIGWQCQSGWTYFSRQLGKWCLLVHSGTVTKAAALASCVAANATLSGPENSAEQTWIISKGVAILLALTGSIRQGSLWVGAQRTSTCLGTKENATGCVPWANNAYEWTDGFTSLKKMMVWTPGQPDYYLTVESCVQMAIVNRTDGSGGAVSGDLADISCTVSTSTANINYIRGYVCGKQAVPIYS